MPRSSAKMRTKLGLSAADAASYAAKVGKAGSNRNRRFIGRLFGSESAWERLRASWRLALIRATRDPAHDRSINSQALVQFAVASEDFWSPFPRLASNRRHVHRSSLHRFFLATPLAGPAQFAAATGVWRARRKAKTTPDVYPMTINGIVSGSNQKSNREPVMSLTAEDVEQVLEELRGMGAVTEVQGSGRVAKYRHHAYEWLGVEKTELAVMTELLLREASRRWANCAEEPHGWSRSRIRRP